MASVGESTTTPELQSHQYTIVGSEHIRSNATYHVAVSVHRSTTGPCIVRISLDNGGDWRLSETVTVRPQSTESVAFELGELPEPAPGRKYRLVAEGIEGIAFRDEHPLQVIAKRMSILVQTDRTKYKPGDLVRFRAIAIDVDTKPVELADALLVYIQDGASNRVKEWTAQSTANGVFEADFRLSDAPVLGYWKLVCEALGESTTRSFEVAEFELPTFETFIEADLNVLLADRKVLAKVGATYTFGKAVSGTASVSLHRAFENMDDGLIARKVLPITGKTAVEFDLDDEFVAQAEERRQLEIRLDVEEAHTGRKQSRVLNVSVYRDEFQIQRNSYNSYYEDGQPFVNELNVRRYDQTPARNETIEVWYCSDLSDVASAIREEYRTDAEGNVTVSTVLPENKNEFFMMVKFRNVRKGLGLFTSTVFRPSQPAQFTIDVKTSYKVTIGEMHEIEVQSARPMNSFTYQVIARGDVLLTSTEIVHDPQPNQTHTIRFPATFEMLSSAKIVVYTVREDGHLDAISDHFYTEVALPNSITLASSVDETQPGEVVELQIETVPKSLVCLMGIDQSVLLAQTNSNDLNAPDLIVDSLLDYGNAYSRPAFYEYQQPRYVGGGSSKLWRFRDVGVIVLSNIKDLIFDEEEEDLCRISPCLFGGARMMKCAAYAAPEMAYDSLPHLQPVRADFPETWIWDSFLIDNESGVHKFSKTVPDSITSWVVTAFAINPQSGMGVLKEPTKLTVLKQFFVSVDLPFSVKRGEIVHVPCTVFNYLDGNQSVTVTLYNSEAEFELIAAENDAATISQQYVQTVEVASGAITAATFRIRPLKLGAITLKVSAIAALAGDTVERILRVSPEGIVQYGNVSALIDLPADSEAVIETALECRLPEHLVSDSAQFEASVIGDPLAASLHNLGRLVYMPSGCGEQNMLNFVPNILVRRYLRTVNRLDDELELKTRLHMEIGYQRQLTYRHRHTGAFSAFGEKDVNGSTWLTAFVARAFRWAAEERIAVEERIVEKALEWLCFAQLEDGSFPEVGRVVGRRLQSGTARDAVALTAYVVLAFVDNRAAFPRHQAVIERALAFVVANLDTLDDDPYSTALAAYALQLAEHPARADVLRRLNARALVIGDRKYWPDGKSTAAGSTVQPLGRGGCAVWPRVPRSAEIEITAYALLANLHAAGDATVGLNDDAVPVMKWLVEQRNQRGGFVGTQDTIVGLHALTAVAGRMQRSARDLRIKLSAGWDGALIGDELQVNDANAHVLVQRPLVSGAAGVIRVRATGQGFALVSLAAKYYVNEASADSRFRVHANVEPTGHEDKMLLVIDSSVAADVADVAQASDLTVMEIGMPSGFTFDTETLDDLKATKGVRRVKLHDGNTRVVLFIEGLGSDEVKTHQVRLQAIRAHRVEQSKAAAVSVYDYYDNTRKTLVFYDVDGGSPVAE